MQTQLPKIKDYLRKSNSPSMVQAFFYNPIGSGSWFVVAGEKLENDFLFYGFVQYGVLEEKFFTLNELKRKKLPFGLKIVQDVYFKPVSLEEALRHSERS